MGFLDKIKDLVLGNKESQVSGVSGDSAQIMSDEIVPEQNQASSSAASVEPETKMPEEGLEQKERKAAEAAQQLNKDLENLNSDSDEVKTQVKNMDGEMK